MNRRSFLKWSGCGLLGLLWPGKGDGRTATPLDVVKTHCDLCPWECGMDVRVQGGRVHSIEGMVEDPETQGGICAAGKEQGKALTDSRRILTPGKREGKKGEGRFRPLSWPEALSLIQEKWTQIRKESGGEAISGFLGGQLSLDGHWMAHRLFSLLGSPNLFLSSTAEHASWNAGGKLLTGGFPSLNLEDLKHSRCLILWGTHQLLSGWTAGQQMVQRLRQRGARMIVIDPRPTPLARQADLWLKARPGTDGLLAWSMAQVILEGNLHDRAFLQRWTTGFEGYAEIASKIEHSPARAEAVCGVPAAKIREAARSFATLQPAMVLGGLGVSQHSNGTQASRAIQSLAVITGNVNRKGGNLFFDHPLESFAGPASLTDRLRNSESWNKRIVELPTGRMDSCRLWDILLADGKDRYWKEHLFGRTSGEKEAYPESYKGKAYPIRSLWIQGGDPLRTLPHALKGKMALEKAEFVVVADSFLTETARYADLILPAALGLESVGLLGGHRSLIRPWLSLRSPAAPPAGACRSHQKILAAVGRALGFGPEFDFSEKQYIDLVLGSSPRTMAWNQETFLKTPGRKLPLFKMSQIFPSPYQKQTFPTASGKIEFQSPMLGRMGFRAYPEWEEPVESAARTPEFHKKYPLTLATGEGPGEELGRAEISGADARKLQVRQGDTIVVESKVGRIRLRASISEDLKPGVVWASASLTRPVPPARSQGHPAIHGVVDDAFNDPVAGSGRANEMLVRIYKGERDPRR